MPHKPGETRTAWFERAIVADSVAAAELDAMSNSSVAYNIQAKAAIYKEAVMAREDLRAARDAYTREHRPPPTLDELG